MPSTPPGGARHSSSGLQQPVLPGKPPSWTSITIHTAGAQFSSDVAEARIKTRDGDTLLLSDLLSLIGKNIKIDGVYERDGRLYARELRVDVGKRQKPKED